MCILLHRELEEIYLFHLKTHFAPRSKNAPSWLCTALLSKATIISISFFLFAGEEFHCFWLQTFAVLWMLYTFRCFPCFWILCVEVSEHSVCCTFVGRLNKKHNWNEIVRVSIEVKFGSTKPKCRHRKFRKRGVTQKKEYNYTVTHWISC
jgi:hypothetical protein